MTSDRWLRGVVSVLVAGLIANVSAAAAQPAAGAAPPPPRPGCEYVAIDPAQWGRQPFRNPPDVSSPAGGLSTTLTVGYTDPAKVSIAGCGVTLRTYNGALVGPTLRVKPGGVMNILLDNVLPRESPDDIEAQFQQESSAAWLAARPGSFNTTNLHTHGLHVSPTGNSDNVLLAIAPQSRFPYEIRVPANHPPGTFWYHAHTHGSTAIQVGSGMSGALIVEDDPAKLPPALREATRREKVFVIQTTLYNTQGELTQIAALFPDPGDLTRCDYSDPTTVTWLCSKRQTTINGQIVPTITMQPGEVQRWRLIDTSFRESIKFRVEGHDLHEIALDGLYLGRVDTWKAGAPLDLEPGYRSDVLIKASARPGRYAVVDGASPAAQSLRGAAEPERLLAIVEVSGAPLDMPLPTSQEMAPLAPFPGVDLRTTADGVQEVVFRLSSDLLALANKPGGRNYFQVNYRSFSPHHKRQVTLGATDQWTLSTVGDVTPTPNPNAIPPAPHVFHIHVNPFQWVRKDPAGQDELVWKDTLLVQPAIVNGTPVTTPFFVWTKYTDYIGQFVMHCHILDHEDLGMMEVVEVVDGASGVATGHGH